MLTRPCSLSITSLVYNKIILNNRDTLSYPVCLSSFISTAEWNVLQFVRHIESLLRMRSTSGREIRTNEQLL